MNKSDIIQKITTATGLDSQMCEQIVKAFEKQSEMALENKLKGIKTDHEQMIQGIAQATGQSTQNCKTVVEALDSVMDDGLRKKFSFFKREQ